jgi:hypothetical protein
MEEEQVERTTKQQSHVRVEINGPVYSSFSLFGNVYSLPQVIPSAFLYSDYTSRHSKKPDEIAELSETPKKEAKLPVDESEMNTQAPQKVEMKSNSTKRHQRERMKKHQKKKFKRIQENPTSVTINVNGNINNLTMFGNIGSATSSSFSNEK